MASRFRREPPPYRRVVVNCVRSIILALTLALASSPLRGGEAEQAVARHQARLAGLRTLVLRVERATTRGGQTVTERWLYRQKGAGQFRVDYQYPTPRTIVCNGTVLWEYLPDERKAAVTQLAKLAEASRRAALRAALGRVALEGLRFEGGPPSRLHGLGKRTIGGRAAYGVECRAESEGPTRVVRGWIDAERGLLVQSECVGAEGQVVLRTSASGALEAAPGVWFPRQIVVERLGPKGRREVSILKQVVLNGSVPDQVFEFHVPDGVEVIGERRPSP